MLNQKNIKLRTNASVDNSPHRELCLACRRPKRTCYCHLIKPFDPGFQFIILIHPREARVGVGTGRMTHLCLINSKLIEGIDFTEDERVNDLIDDKNNYPVVLYPGAKSVAIDKEPLEFIPADKNLLLFVIDGTWSQAKKIMKMSRNLHKLPRISFTPAGISKYTIRVEPDEVCVSTIEAVHRVIDIFDSRKRFKVSPKKAHNNLLDVFSKMVSRQVDFAKDQNIKGYRKWPYKPKAQVQKAKKWLTRSLFFKD